MIAMVDGLSIQYALDSDNTGDIDAAVALWEKMTRCLLSDLGLVDMG